MVSGDNQEAGEGFEEGGICFELREREDQETGEEVEEGGNCCEL